MLVTQEDALKLCPGKMQWQELPVLTALLHTVQHIPLALLRTCIPALQTGPAAHPGGTGL